METVIFKSNSKKDMNLLVSLVKKIRIEVKKLPSNKTELDENDPAYELKVERNLGRIMNEYRNSPSVRYEEVLKVLNRWK